MRVVRWSNDAEPPGRTDSRKEQEEQQEEEERQREVEEGPVQLSWLMPSYIICTTDSLLDWGYTFCYRVTMWMWTCHALPSQMMDATASNWADKDVRREAAGNVRERPMH